jgi:hexosaminidase
MNRSILAIVLSIFIVSASIAQTPQIIPQPISLKTKTGHFVLTRETRIIIPAENAEAKKLGELLAGMLEAPTGHKYVVSTVSRSANAIHLKLNKETYPVIGAEGYQLKVTAASVTISANNTKGLFYGIQTLMQLLPPDIEAKQKITGVTWSIPAVDITDYPRFGWRGLMLDVTRHFFPKQVVENYIDEMSKYKFNMFHMHLADDEGWRIEIKSLPQLTKVGAYRVMRTGPFHFAHFDDAKPDEPATYGGFYTQDDMRDIIKYAKDRYITILPEIDVPAHSLALIATFPNLSCTKIPYAVNPGTDFYTKTDDVLHRNSAAFPVPLHPYGRRRSVQRFLGERS